MNTTQIGTSSLLGGRLAYGCWRIAGNHPAQLTPQQADAGRRAVIAAYEAGYTLFDHADIYGRGVAETLFGQVLKEIAGLRDRIVIATKCGVCPKGIPEPNLPARWDFSARHIVAACEFPLVAHQVEISLAKLDAFTDGTLDQCLQDRMTPMAWSPLAGGLLGDGARRLLPAQQGYRVAPIVTMLDEMARERGVSRAVIALAWLLKHPGKIVPIVGSTNPDRIRDAAKAADLDLSREEWYRLLEAARDEPLP